MKSRISLYILFFGCCISMYAQNIQNLDIKNGINKFKLCSFLELNKASLKEIPNTKDVLIKWYTYTGNDVPQIFEYKVKEIVLGYYKNKLYKISVLFDENQAIKTDEIKNKLELLFSTGQFKENYTDDKHHDWSYTWQTNKTYLCFDKVAEKELRIWVYSKIIEKQIIFDEL